MQAPEFASLYDPEMPEEHWPQSEFSALLEPGRQWSMLLGKALHACLEEPGTKANPEVIQGYVNWTTTDLPDALDTVYDSPNSDAKFRAMGNLNWHVLARGMAKMWAPLVYGVQPIKEHAHNIRFGKDMLGMSGIDAVRQREKNASIQTGHAYFNTTNSRYRAILEGTLNEYDTGIVLMEAVKKYPNLAVLPAPIQFEQGHDPTKNANFIVVDSRGYAVGVQTMASAKPGMKREYNDKAIVVVDGREDLGNALYKRTTKGKSQEKQVSWAGLICAHVVANIDVRGDKPGLTKSSLASQGPDARRAFLTRRLAARQLLGNLRPNLHQAAELVGSRVMSKLYEGSSLTPAFEPQD